MSGCPTYHRDVPVICLRCGRVIKYVRVCSHIVGDKLYSSCSVYNEKCRSHPITIYIKPNHPTLPS